MASSLLPSVTVSPLPPSCWAEAVIPTPEVNTGQPWVAAAYGNLPMCIFLLTRGADLYALMPGGERTALQRYGEFARPLLPPAVSEERLALLQHACDEGPHPNAFNSFARWARHWPFMQVMVFNDFQPLLARQLILLTLNPPLPPDASIPPVIISTVAQRRAFLNMNS